MDDFVNWNWLEKIFGIVGIGSKSSGKSIASPRGDAPFTRNSRHLNEHLHIYRWVGLTKPGAWLIYAFIIIAILLASLWFLWPNTIAFPMDDAYIHFVYAQNLVEHGSLVFNEPNENGVGTTSLLWVLLLALGYVLGLPFNLVARLLGSFSLLGLGLGWFLLWRPLLGNFYAALSALLIVLSGHMLWFALSGMETVLFLVLGVFALHLYKARHWIWLGIVLGLLILTRPEGLALLLVVGFVDVWHNKTIRRGIVWATLIATFIGAIWFGYNFWRSGHFIPTSGVGKQISMQVGMQVVAQRNELLSFVGHASWIILPLLWMLYLIEFVLGGISLPPPYLPVGSLIGNQAYKFSIWAVVGLLVVIAPLIGVFSQKVARRHKWGHWISKRNYRPIVVFAIWVILHNLVYLLVLPIPGTASRYGAINHIALWTALTIGLCYLNSRYLIRILLACGLGAIAIANTVYWNRVYDANIDHMLNVRIKAAEYVRDKISTDSICAASDIGAMRFFSQRRIVDLCGLIDPKLGPIFLAGDMDRYLLEKDVSCLILPGGIGVSEDGWFDHAEILGFSDTSLFDMHLIAEYRIDRERWLLGYLPTQNYQASVNIYKLIK